jgi:radical SAM superfamily enzyme YgiQ (UPF0313 family)
MRILLVHPGVPAYGGKEAFRTFYPPLGLACVAAPLIAAGHEVRILDCAIEGLDTTAVAQQARQWRPDLLGLRCQFINYPLGLATAQAVRAAVPTVRTVFGGPHMGLVAEQAITDHAVDAVVHGEGEQTLLEYVTALAEGLPLGQVKGLIWRDPAGGAVRNAAREIKTGYLDYRQPAFDLLPMHLFRTLNFFSLEGHRGCPMRCTFCSLPAVQTHRVRYKKPRALVDEMERLLLDFGINRFELIEVNFTIHKGWTREVCTDIIERRLPLQWICRSYPELVDQPTLEIMRDAGCYRIYYGIESGSPQILSNYKKLTTVERAAEAIRMTKSAGIQVYCDFLVGGPGETAETVEQTVRFIHKAQPDYADISLLVPFPGTPIYEHAEDYGVRIFDRRWYEDPDAVAQFPYVRVMELDTMPLKELEKLWVHAVTSINCAVR